MTPKCKSNNAGNSDTPENPQSDSCMWKGESSRHN
jgi:hypothetical protein